MKPVKVYSLPTCPFCMKAKELLASLDIPYEDVDVATHPEERDMLAEKHHWQTVPAIFIGDTLIGGYDDLSLLVHEDKLDEILGR